MGLFVFYSLLDMLTKGGLNMIKKSILFVLVICMLLLGTGTAFADKNIDFSSSKGTVTVTVGGLGESEETTLMVVKEGVTIRLLKIRIPFTA